MASPIAGQWRDGRGFPGCAASAVADRGRLRRLPVLFVTLAVALLLWPSVGGAVDCTADGPAALQTAVTAAAPFTFIGVTGNCSPVIVESNKVGLTLHGGDLAVIQTAQPGATAITVRGATQVTIRNFAGLTTNTTDGTGIVVVDGASVRILSNTIVGNRDGILVQRNAQARINENTIRSNSDAGVRIRETSSARVSHELPQLGSNTIQDNGVGVEVLRGSSARIFANQIVDNQTAGVRVDRGSQADITSNTIDGNGVNGIEVLRSSSVVLGTGMGTGPEDGPNTGTSTGFAVLCSLNSSVDGRLGALSGTNRRKVEALEACVNSTSP
jgi:parallel beta-helix repeat protein